jgi:hypothetical protein
MPLTLFDLPIARAEIGGTAFLLVRAEHLARAHQRFVEIEPRVRTYDRATEAVEQALANPEFSAAQLKDALHILLLDWNKRFYATHPRTAEYVGTFEELLARYRSQILRFRVRDILAFTGRDDEALILFARFSEVLGPVGAAKTLHMLAPRFFTLWDNDIAYCYSLYPNHGGWQHYFRLMRVRRQQCESLNGDPPDALKLLDELDYVLYTMREGAEWLRDSP